MSNMHLDRSIIIDKPANEIYPHISDFNNWSAWSPWTILDDKTKVKVSEDGKFYEWESAIIGSGNMKMLSENTNQSLDIELKFLKPWKSKANVSFKLIPKGQSTEVHWIMDSKMPFFMFFFKKMMETFVGMDFDRGLTLLKEQVEKGSVDMKLTVEGFREFKGVKYIGLKSTGRFSEIKELMGRDFGKLMNFAGENLQGNMENYTFSILTKFKPTKDYIEYIAAIPVKDNTIELPNGLIKGDIPAMKIHVAHLKGSYKFLGNLWSVQTQRFRSKVFKVNKKNPPMEIYLNNPQNTEEKNLETEVWYPSK